MAIISPVLQQNVPIVKPDTGLATTDFAVWMNNTFNLVITQLNNNTSVIAALQANQAQILALQQQLVAVQQAQAPASGQFGNASLLGGAVGSTWTLGPLVSLTGVAAGNLTFPGSGPNQVDSTEVNPGGGAGTFTGNWRIVEIVGAVETTVFTGDYVAQRMRDDGALPFASVVYNTSSTSVSVPQTSTGAVDYRLDLQAHDAVRGDFEVDAVQLNLYVNRA